MDENWDSIAGWYAELVRNSSPMHEWSRDILLSALPANLAGLHILDVGCGEGIVTRALANRGAHAVGIDPTRLLITHAQALEESQPTGALYRDDDGLTLSTVTNDSMDGVTAGLSLNNIPDLRRAVSSIRRVLKPGGFLAFTVPHPCFDAPNSSSVTTESGQRRVIGDYLSQGFWRSTHPQSVRRAGNYHRLLSTYLSVVIDHGFVLQLCDEPAPNNRVKTENPQRAGLPPFFLVRAASPLL
ncbi:class I SAM-dependent methyltransferase [Mycolicibacterium stellerae]|uniref:class I SAM-dependent methyltransferase n=1 Tax=Mycolicibacterium stellerae TaxID=2358193 RepID=UPI000F0BD74B|nr:class I SAM-dependent methyltransferase [Mycolicibacterium stellerae]